MKNLKYVAVALLLTLLLPSVAFAKVEADKELAKGSLEVPIYLFRGEGCSHCAEAEAWFKTIEEEYGSKFEVIGYETWYNSDNADLMKAVASKRGEKANGVPYIIIGDQSWNGFSHDFTEDMIKKIDEVYAQDVNSRYDSLKGLESGNYNKKDSKNDILSLVIIIAAGIAIGAVLFFTKEKTNKIDSNNNEKTLIDDKKEVLKTTLPSKKKNNNKKATKKSNKK